MTQFADAQMHINLWINRYFEKFGDSAPNRNETYLIITVKLNVYYQYKSETDKIGMKTTDESTFISIWNALYPRFINSPGLISPENAIRALRSIDKNEYVKKKHC